MEPNFQLTPESARALALRLFTKEQFAANPRACVLKALDWLDAAAGDRASGESPGSATPSRSALIERLDELVKIKGLETIAGAIDVSHQTIRGWLRGVAPTESNRKRIEQFLNEAPPSDAAGAEQRVSGELFTEPALDPTNKLSKLIGEPPA
jgi:hypothetical protein